MMKKINLIFILFTFLLLSSCANSIDVDSDQYGNKIINTDSVLSKESEKELMRSFSCILSKAVYNIARICESSLRQRRVSSSI